MQGIFNLYKRVGSTSHDVVAQVRRITRVRRVGHGGTLDPFAAGVLPIFVGPATRVVEYLEDERKVYCAEIVLGVSTDTYDIEGRITDTREVPDLSRDDVEAVAAGFIGRIEQTPPIYSAIKVEGERLYRQARAGKEIQVPARQVDIYRITVLQWRSPVLAIEVECGRGVYIRSLANDIGEKLGSGAYLHSLLRTQSGRFFLEDSLDLEDLQDAVDLGYWDKVAYAPDEVLVSWEAVVLSDKTIIPIKQGRDWSPRTGAIPLSAGRLRAYSVDGEFAAVLSRVGGEDTWHPSKVFDWGS